MQPFNLFYRAKLLLIFELMGKYGGANLGYVQNFYFHMCFLVFQKNIWLFVQSWTMRQYITRWLVLFSPLGNFAVLSIYFFLNYMLMSVLYFHATHSSYISHILINFSLIFHFLSPKSFSMIFGYLLCLLVWNDGLLYDKLVCDLT